MSEQNERAASGCEDAEGAAGSDALRRVTNQNHASGSVVSRLASVISK